MPCSRFKAVQAAVIMFTLGLLSAGIYGTCNIKVEFDPFKMLSQDSYLKQFLDTYKKGTENKQTRSLEIFVIKLKIATHRIPKERMAGQCLHRGAPLRR